MITKCSDLPYEEKGKKWYHIKGKFIIEMPSRSYYRVKFICEDGTVFDYGRIYYKRFIDLTKSDKIWKKINELAGKEVIIIGYPRDVTTPTSPFIEKYLKHFGAGRKFIVKDIYTPEEYEKAAKQLNIARGIMGLSLGLIAGYVMYRIFTKRE